MKKEIDHRVLNNIIFNLPEDAKISIKKEVEDLNLIINEIESRQPTTKNYYGDYLPHATNKTSIAMLILAGANKEGVTMAAKINEIEL